MQNTTEQNNIIIYIDCYERCNFFIRLANAGMTLGYTFIFLTDSITSYLHIRKHGFLCKIIRKYNKNKRILTKKYIENSLDIINKRQTLKYAVQYAESICDSINKILKHLHISYFFIWNGSNTAGLAIKALAKKIKIKTIFFEISNLPNKLFVDIDGVNAQSFIYKNISILEKSPNIPENIYELWKRQWWSYKLNPIPQSKIKGKFNKNYYIDRLYSLLPNKIFCNELKIKNKNKNKNKNKIINNLVTNNKTIKYIFLPLQVSSDSQLKINSDFNNLDAINYAANISKSRNLDLVIKIHPAEYDNDELTEIIKLKNNLNFYISNENTNNLIKNSECVCVINSTVGLEAMILQKELYILGRAIYSRFTPEILKKYIFNWLINIDYFSNEEIDPNEFMRIINLANYCYDH
ncbi:hypothetical protein ISO36_14220 [Morganella morganii subsp. morganii]|uniref:capsular polysaccharide export protein, LipB/KpsS family n=1 Tax=Morganella morganii TaxID=582 RepID=UPI001BDAD9A7|nr:hypothetical protein [Morganella morganii]MBT0371549.1 hypothetical protein [Morganella morganii subsp. morganii]